ncbi:S-adenosylmethionine:tRNA ribosyltransferase-isomerase [Cyanobacteria bacterium FACHB-472]|nr:S-adenosylmethionine:tRNA ribosyltransferase-isomerase [Cyanobacteria bacterium FACHB-472]
MGTTVVKALESVVDETRYLSAEDGYTRLHITSDRKPRSVDGLLPRSQ